MATRQYIGARYVPKFYQNSVDGSTQWESNVVYEPLTYVTLTNGHMYISKKQVPATVGSPVSNIEYWLDIGSYNGFIEELQDEIDDITNVVIPALQDDIALKQNITDNTLTTTSKTVVGSINEVAALKQNATDNNLTTTAKTVVGAINELAGRISDNWLANKTMVIFGDSLLTTRARLTIQPYLEAKVPSLTITNHAVDGTNMQAIATSVATYASDVANADVVLINGGTNDWQESNATLNYKNSLVTAIDNIITANPTCRILFMTSPYSVNPTMTSQIYNNIGAALEVYNAVSIATCKSYGVNVIDAYHCTPCNADTYTSLMVDDVAGYYVHPSVALCDYITDLIVNESFSIANPTIQAHNITSAYGTVQAGSFIEFNPDEGVYHGSVNLNLTSDITTTNIRLLEWKIGGTMQAFAPQNIGLRSVGIHFNNGNLFTFNVVNEILTLEKLPAGVSSIPSGNILTFNF